MTISIPSAPGRARDIALAASVHLAMGGAWTAAQLAAILDALRPAMAAQGFAMRTGDAGPAQKSAARAYRECACEVASSSSGAALGLEVYARILMNLDSSKAGALCCHVQFLARRIGPLPGLLDEPAFLFGRALVHPLDAVVLRQDRARALELGVAGCLGENPQATLESLANDFVQQLAERLQP